MSSIRIGLLSVASTTRVILSHAFPESHRLDWTPTAASGSSPRHCPRGSASRPPGPPSRIGARCCGSLRSSLTADPAPAGVSIYAGNAVGKNLIANSEGFRFVPAPHPSLTLTGHEPFA